MSEPEQCIICLDPLPRPSSLEVISEAASNNVAAIITDDAEGDPNYLNIVASLDGCDHIIHDACIRSWAQKTNTCPICRKAFNHVRVYNGIDGTAVSSYDVKDKKQVAEFDVQQWLGENPEDEEEESNPCPICNSAEREDVLLLCDSCDAAYHTHCIGLEYIPEGDWYCMECAHLFELTEEAPQNVAVSEIGTDSVPTRPQSLQRPLPRTNRGFHVRTRARLRRARRQARNAEWQGAWGQFSGRFYEMSDLDLDNLDEDEDLERFRLFQQLDRQELQRWQQRMDIAQRLGARDAFVNNIPPQISERLQPPAPPPPPPVEETRDERRAWGALDRVRDSDGSSPSRKRKARSVTASPVEPLAQEPERKLKRPRTRRLPTHAEGSNPAPAPAIAGPSVVAQPNGSSLRNGREDHEPALVVSSLLKELEPHGQSDDEAFGANWSWRHIPEASSPALSPSPSAYSSPRALSLTPPPLPSVNGRPTSPTLSLSTHIEPVYPPANYSPTRYHSDHSDSESRPIKSTRPKRPPPLQAQQLPPQQQQQPQIQPQIQLQPESRPLELRQPRPRRTHDVSPPPAPRADDASSRWTMTQEEKKNINEIVKNALRPHWRAQKLTTEQYATINRDISRKLYDEVKDAASLDNSSRQTWEKRATQEVAQAVSELQA